MLLISLLPSCILCDVIMELLDTASVSRLDASVCSQKLRTQFLEVLTSNLIPSNGANKIPSKASIKYFQWLQSRKMTVKFCNVSDPNVGILEIISSDTMANLTHLAINKYAQSEVMLCHLPIKMSNLKSLHLTNSTHITESIVVQFCAHCPRLNVISFGGCVKVTDNAILCVAQTYNTQLLKLNISKCFNAGNATRLSFQHICNHCPNLIYLNISNCVVVTDTDMDRLCAVCSELRELSILGCSRLQDFTALTIADHCKHLVALDACSCYFLDAEIRTLTTECKELQRLSLSHNVLLTDVGVGHVARNCRHLCTLFLANCTGITDEGIAVLAKCRSTDLTELNLSLCAQLTNLSMYSLYKHCHSLTKLNVSYCEKLTSLSLVRLRDKLLLPVLKELVCTACYLCTGVAVLRWYRPEINIT